MTRKERVEELIREEVSQILRQRVSDPRIGFVSITGVEMSPDLKNASIYVSIFSEESKKVEAMDGLHAATGFIRRELGQMLELRSTPQIRFVRDDSLERGSRILNVMQRLENEKSIQRNKRGRKKS